MPVHHFHVFNIGVVLDPSRHIGIAITLQGELHVFRGELPEALVKLHPLAQMKGEHFSIAGNLVQNLLLPDFGSKDMLS